METKAPVLSIRDISKSFSGIQVLNNVNLDLYPGEVHCLVGENGAGKSTIIKIISGAYHADHGTVTFQGVQTKHFTPRWARENGINTIYQEIDLIPTLSVAENISLGNEPLKKNGEIDWSASRQRAEKIFNDMGGVPIDVNSMVGSLKVAYQQMVAIAKALSLNSKVLILDEPTAVFTSSEVEVLFAIISRLKSQGIALLYISHHLDEIFQIGDRVTVLRDGSVIRTGAVGEFDKNQLVKAMVGRDIDLSMRNNSALPGEEVLRVAALTRKGMVSDINLTLHRGEVVGIAGLVGAGRTELARLIVGADKPDSGQVLLKRKPIKIHSLTQVLDAGIGMLPESRKEEGLVLIRSAYENAAYSLVVRQTRFGLVSWRQIKQKVLDILKAIEIRPAKPNLQVYLMSGGNQQKVVLAKILSAQCDVIILDEPTRGVDVGARMEIYKVIQGLKQQGKSILMISSDLPEILTQSDRVLVMAKGRIVGELMNKDATEEKILSMALEMGEKIQ